MQTFDAAVEGSRPAPGLRLLVMGLLILWCPYVFVWFVNKPSYPKAFRVAAVGWAVFQCACLILFLVVGGDRAPHAR
jgi:hypothetical protein